MLATVTTGQFVRLVSAIRRNSRKGLLGIEGGETVEVLHTMPSRFGGHGDLAVKVRHGATGIERWTTNTNLVEASAPLPTKTVTCSKCGQQGHNARTCGNIAVSSSSHVGQGINIPSAGAASYRPEPETIPPTPEPVVKVQAVEKDWRAPLDPCWAIVEAFQKDTSENARRVLLYGPPATGKTYAANHAGINGQRVLNHTMTEETPAAELRGHFIPTGGGNFEFMYGPNMKCFVEGWLNVENEIDKASGDALSFFHAYLDDRSMSEFTLPTGETVTPHENFRCWATTNGVPEDLPDAVRSRFPVAIEIPKPHPDVIALLPNDLRKAAWNSFDADPDRAVDMRSWLAFASSRETHGEKIAAAAVFGERAEEILNTIRISQTL